MKKEILIIDYDIEHQQAIPNAMMNVIGVFRDILDANVKRCSIKEFLSKKIEYDAIIIPEHDIANIARYKRFFNYISRNTLESKHYYNTIEPIYKLHCAHKAIKEGKFIFAVGTSCIPLMHKLSSFDIIEKASDGVLTGGYFNNKYEYNDILVTSPAKINSDKFTFQFLLKDAASFDPKFKVNIINPKDNYILCRAIDKTIQVYDGYNTNFVKRTTRCEEYQVIYNKEYKIFFILNSMLIFSVHQNFNELKKYLLTQINNIFK